VRAVSDRAQPIPNAIEERALQQAGYSVVAGLDEAGRGAWAGPLVAAAVVVPPLGGDVPDALVSVRDSKLLTSECRVEAFDKLLVSECSLGVGFVSSIELELLGLTAANELAMMRAVECLPIEPEALLVDAFRLRSWSGPQKGIVHGDARCVSIAAASVVAKVVRDRWMVMLDAHYPGYGLAGHKGYGVPSHRRALDRLGPSAIHRRSYRPVAALIVSEPA